MKNNKAFTLIELIIAITMLSIIMLSIFTIYFNIINANKKLELTRILQENSRNITENIAKDIREKGIDYVYHRNYDPIDYSWWNAILAIKNSWGVYCLINKNTPNSCDNSSCTWSNLKNCYFGKRGWNAISDERVMINKLRFFISWNGDDITNEWNEWKVTVIFELSDLSKSTKFSVETTISEKVYKK